MCCLPNQTVEDLHIFGESNVYYQINYIYHIVEMFVRTKIAGSKLVGKKWFGKWIDSAIKILTMGKI